jgi:hypothetical protein
VRLGAPQRQSGSAATRTAFQSSSSGLEADLGLSPTPVVHPERIALSQERRELLCSLIGLTVKLGLVVVGVVSLCRLAAAYQQRMERQGEISAVLELQTAKLAKARERFDQLFMEEGEQRLIREQSQWIAPNRMRIVWGRASDALPAEQSVNAVDAPAAGPQVHH